MLIRVKSGSRYIYNPQKNSLFRLTESAFREYQEMLCSNESVTDLNAKRRSTMMNFLGYQFPLPLSSFDYGKDVLGRRTTPQSITFCITHQCNMRCSYCVYGGKYSKKGFRTHSSENMTFTTIKKTLETLFDILPDGNKHTLIWFYGGEPLLRKDLILQTVDYIQKMYPDFFCSYGIATNGTLLDSDIVDFFEKNQFIIQVSIDGDKDIHDRNRRYVNNNKTFDDVMANLLNIYHKHQAYYNDFFRFAITVQTEEDLKKAISFFSDNYQLFQPKQILISKALSIDDNDTSSFDYVYDLIINAQQKLVNCSKPKITNNNLAKYEFELGRIIFFTNILTIHKHISVTKLKDNKIYPSGLCVPGFDRIFVEVDGKYSICEKIPVSLSEIGSDIVGVDVNKVNYYLNEFQNNMINKCKNCWAINLLQTLLCKFL